MSAIIQASPLEKLSQERLPAGDSCVLVIFGASGDLTKRKLIPSLYNLAWEGCMNPEFEVLGIGRTPMSSEEFMVVRMSECRINFCCTAIAVPTASNQER